MVQPGAAGALMFQAQALLLLMKQATHVKMQTIIFRGETTPEGDVIPASGNSSMYNQKSYVPFSLYVSGYNEGCQQNIIKLRYADVLL